MIYEELTDDNLSLCILHSQEAKGSRMSWDTLEYRLFSIIRVLIAKLESIDIEQKTKPGYRNVQLEQDRVFIRSSFLQILLQFQQHIPLLLFIRILTSSTTSRSADGRTQRCTIPIGRGIRRSSIQDGTDFFGLF